MNKEDLVKLGIVSFVFLIIVVLVVLVMSFSENDNSKPEEINLPFAMEEVTEYSYFFSVVNSINQYISYISNRSASAVYNTLSKEYIRENQITIDNAFSKLESYGNDTSIRVKNMYYQQYENNSLFYIKGDIVTSYFENTLVTKENAGFFVFVDYTNLTYAIYPLKTEIEEESLPFSIESIIILKNNDNALPSSGMINDNYICNLYFSDFYNHLVENMEQSYDLLEESFKQQKYNTKEKYLQFMNNKIENLDLEMQECLQNQNSDKKREYTIRMKDNSTYTFIEFSIMNYKVKFNMN